MSVKSVTWEDYCNSLDFMGIPSGSLRDWQREVPKTTVTKKVTRGWLQTRVSPQDFEVKCPSLQQKLTCLQKKAFSLYFISSAVKGVDFVRSKQSVILREWLLWVILEIAYYLFARWHIWSFQLCLRSWCFYLVPNYLTNSKVNVITPHLAPSVLWFCANEFSFYLQFTN